jgi:hypothetical protein
MCLGCLVRTENGWYGTTGIALHLLTGSRPCANIVRFEEFLVLELKGFRS